MEKVYNQNKTEILTNYDLSKGELKQDTIEIKHEAQPEIEGKGHYEVVKEYSNGGKDLKYVVEQEYKPAVKEYTEIKKVLVYIPFTDERLKKDKITHEIRAYKKLLADTDYQAIKYFEGELTADEYAPTKQKRKEWRAKINELEKQL